MSEEYRYSAAMNPCIALLSVRLSNNKPQNTTLQMRKNMKKTMSVGVCCL